MRMQMYVYDWESLYADDGRTANTDDSCQAYGWVLFCNIRWVNKCYYSVCHEESDFSN